MALKKPPEITYSMLSTNEITKAWHYWFQSLKDLIAGKIDLLTGHTGEVVVVSSDGGIEGGGVKLRTGTSGYLVDETLAQTLTHKTLTAPTIADFTNAQHDHTDADDGGVIAGMGTVSGPATSTTLHAARWEGTSGKILKDSNFHIADSGGSDIPTGEQYNVNGSQHPHLAADVKAPTPIKSFLRDNGTWQPLRDWCKNDRTYYVRGADGSDSNNGEADTAAGAWKTIQHAVNFVGELDINNQNITIRVRAGTYTLGVLINGPWVGSGTVTLWGDTTTPSDCTISTTNAHAIEVKNGGRLSVKGLKLVATGGVSSGICCSNSGRVTCVGLMEFGACTFFHLYSHRKGFIESLGDNFTLSGGATAHAEANTGGLIYIRDNTVTTAGTPAFSLGFAVASRNGIVEYFSNTFSGTGATGPRFNVQQLGNIFTNGGGLTYFPGDAAGVVDATTFGLYT
jgi:hypothetical protein